jgi:DNA (cytosine-5)-methyltransferase 1
MQKPKFIDLFCGAGGLGIGLAEAGFENVLSTDSDYDAIQTMNSHSNHPVLQSDIIDLIQNLETGQVVLPEIDLVAGGPPCQGFCAINPRRSENDPRNSLVDSFLHVVSIIQPKAVLMENVTGLLSLAKGIAIKKIEKRLKCLGYNVCYKVLQAAHYGAPQSRWRLFVVALKKGDFQFPVPTHAAQIVPNFVRGRELTFEYRDNDLFSSVERHPTVWDAISDLPPLENGEIFQKAPYTKVINSSFQEHARLNCCELTNHQTKRLAPVNMERVLALPDEGMNWTNLPIDLLPNNLKKMQQKYGNRVGAKTRFSRLKKNGLFSTIVTSPDPYWGKFIHPTQNRVISVREAARAQTFRDEIEFSGSVNSKYSQVGNAVPPLMAKAVGEKIRTFV